MQLGGHDLYQILLWLLYYWQWKSIGDFGWCDGTSWESMHIGTWWVYSPPWWSVLSRPLTLEIQSMSSARRWNSFAARLNDLWFSICSRFQQHLYVHLRRQQIGLQLDASRFEHQLLHIKRQSIDKQGKAAVKINWLATIASTHDLWCENQSYYDGPCHLPTICHHIITWIS